MIVQCDVMWKMIVQCDVMRKMIVQCDVMRKMIVQCDVMLKIICQCDVTHMMLPIKIITSVLKVSTNIITSIPASLAAIPVIMPVSTELTAVILLSSKFLLLLKYFLPKCI